MTEAVAKLRKQIPYQNHSSDLQDSLDGTAHPNAYVCELLSCRVVHLCDSHVFEVCDPGKEDHKLSW